MQRLAWLKRFSLWASVVFVLSVALILGPLHLLEPLNLLPHFALIISGGFLLFGLFAVPASQWWKKLIKLTLLLLMALSLGLLTLVILLTTYLQLSTTTTRDIDCGPSLECRVYSRGNFGNYWQDLVQRQRYLGFIYVETPLTQFDREVVNTLRFDAQSQGLILEVEEYGQAPRTVNIALPLPASAAQ